MTTLSSMKNYNMLSVNKAINQNDLLQVGPLKVPSISSSCCLSCELITHSSFSKISGLRKGGESGRLLVCPDESARKQVHVLH